MSQQQLELTYFASPGRASPARYLLHDAGVEYKEVHVEYGKMAEIRAEGVSRTPFGVFPTLRDGTLFLDQSCAILMYLGQKYGYLPADFGLACKSQAYAMTIEDLYQALLPYWTAPDDAARTKALNSFIEDTLIERYLPRFDAHLAANGNTGYLVGDSVSIGDFAVFFFLRSIVHDFGSAYARERLEYSKWPHVDKFMRTMAERPKLAAYLKSQA